MEEKDRRLLLPKATSGARKNVRRLVRPRLRTEEVQQQDTGKQLDSLRQDAAAEGSLGTSSVQQPPRKRQLAPSAAELADQSTVDGESALKRSKGLDLPQQEDATEGQTVEPVGSTAAAEEVFDGLPQSMDKDASGDMQMEDAPTDKVVEDQEKEPLPLDGTSEENLDGAGSGQGDMSGIVPSSDVVPIAEDQTEQGNTQQMVEESDKEEGEVASDVADPEEGGGGAVDVSPEAGAEEGEKPEEATATTPMASPSRGGDDVDAVLEETDNNSSQEAAPQDDEKAEDGEIMDDSVADADEPSETKIEMEQQQESSEAVPGGEGGVLPTPPPPIQRSPSPSLSPSSLMSPSLTSVGSSSTTINLRERARENAALRQAGALPSTTPSRGRAVRGRVARGRGARTGRGGRGQSSGESGQGSR